LFARLHHVHDIALMAVATDGQVDGLGGPVHGPEGRQRVQYHAHPGIPEFGHAEQRGLTELRDIGQQGNRDRVAEALVGLQIVGRFREDGIGPRFNAGASAFDRCIYSVHRDGVRASDQIEVLVGTRVGGGLHAIRHLLRADNFLTRTMAATLGPDLVFNVATGGAEFDQALNRTRDIEGGRTEAGIDVRDQRNVTDVGGPAYIGQNVV